MVPMLPDIATGVLVNVITSTGRWIAKDVGRKPGRDGDIAAWFDTYELVGSMDFPELISEEDASTWLRRNDVHAVLHELLAARMTDATETEIERLRGSLRRTAAERFGLRADGLGNQRSFGSEFRVEMRLDPEYGLVRAPGAIDKARENDRRLISARMAPEIADRFFDWADGEICELVARFEARDPERWRQARQDAFGARIVAVLNAIDQHVAALNAAPDPEVDAKWLTQYRRQARQAYGSITPPDFARRRPVPVEDLYVPPRVVEPGAARDADGNPYTIGFDDLAGRVDRTVLLGDPGGGKSTASRVLTHRWAGDEAARVPFLVVLRDFAAGGGPRGSVVEHIEERLNTFHQCPAPDGAVERLLLSGGAAVIFDGLDELIDTGRRVEVTQVVEQFSVRFPLAPVLVTSRIVGYDQARLDDTQFDVYRIAGFSRYETAAYVQNWFAHEDGVDADEAVRLAEAFMRESEQVTDLRSNPLMLALMCILYRGEGTLPRNRPGVYAECAKLLYDKWDTRRGIHVDLAARNLIEPVLRHIAYWLFTRDGSPEVTEAELVGRVADLLHDRGFEQRHDAEAAAGEFVAFLRGRGWILGDAGTTVRGDPLYTFTHRTFLEYFAAAHLASVTDTPEDLARVLLPYVSAGEWDVVGQLTVQIKDGAVDRGAERVLRTLLDEQARAGEFRRESWDSEQANLVAFAARCVDAAEVPPALVREIANRAFDQLSEDANHALTYLPLWRDRVGEIIADVLAERVASLMASDDPDARRLGGRFSVYATFCAAANANSAYWHRLERQLTAEYRDTLVEMARTDDAIWMRLIDRGWITLAEALKLRDMCVDVLLRTIRVPFADRYWPPYVQQGLFTIQRGGRRSVGHHGNRARYYEMQMPDPDAAVDRISAFAQALPGLPAPPWPVTWIRERFIFRLHIGELKLQADTTATDAAAALVLTAMTKEHEIFFRSASDLTRERRQFRCDELRARAAEAPEPLPTYIDRWFSGEFDFVQWPHDEHGSG